MSLVSDISKEKEVENQTRSHPTWQLRSFFYPSGWSSCQEFCFRAMAPKHAPNRQSMVLHGPSQRDLFKHHSLTLVGRKKKDKEYWKNSLRWEAFLVTEDRKQKCILKSKLWDTPWNYDSIGRGIISKSEIKDSCQK